MGRIGPQPLLADEQVTARVSELAVRVRRQVRHGLDAAWMVGVMAQHHRLLYLQENTLGRCALALGKRFTPPTPR